MTKHMDRVIEDAEFLINTGEWPERIAQRLGYKSAGGVLRVLETNHRPDLARAVRRLDRTSHTFIMSHLWPTDGTRR